MRGEWIETWHGQVSHASPELSSACSLKTCSRAGKQAYHNVSRPRRACPFLPQPLLHGLDTSWSQVNCPHREGTPMNGCGRRWTTGRRGIFTGARKRRRGPFGATPVEQVSLAVSGYKVCMLFLNVIAVFQV